MKILTLITLITLLGCASHPDTIEAIPANPSQYENWDCEQLKAESFKVEKQTIDLYDQLLLERNKDEAQLFILVGAFWLEGGDGEEAQQFSILKGEYEAIGEVAQSKQCEFGRFSDFESFLAEADKAGPKRSYYPRSN